MAGKGVKERNGSFIWHLQYGQTAAEEWFPRDEKRDFLCQFQKTIILFQRFQHLFYAALQVFIQITTPLTDPPLMEITIFSSTSSISLFHMLAIKEIRL